MIECNKNEYEFRTQRQAYDLNMSEKAELVRRSDVEAGKFRDMHELLGRVERNEVETTNNLMAENRNREDIKLLNAQLTSQNFDMKREIEAL